MLKALLLFVASTTLFLVLGTYYALEADDVVIVKTADSSEGIRETHIWHVEHEGRLFLEAGSPKNSWVRDLENAPTIELSGQDLDGTYSFSIKATPDDHKRIRSLMRRKYGWRDWWISILFDTSQSMLIEVKPTSSPNLGLERDGLTVGPIGYRQCPQNSTNPESWC